MKILKNENLNGWHIIEMTMPLEKQLSCPACNVPLFIIGILKGKQTIRIGGCDMCGYMGYIDRPSPEWFTEFYSSKWDMVGQKERKEIENDFDLLQKESPKIFPKTISNIMLKAAGDINKPLLEIGSGFGHALHFAKARGYKEIYGVEASTHRADMTEKYGFSTYRGKFEEIDFKGKKFGTILHHHVLEHVRDVNLFIQKCAAIQETGDKMLIGIPNNLGEPSMGIFMYLPHIHSFAITSIIRLVGKFNYEALDFSLTDKNYLNVVAIKRDHPMGTIPIKGHMNQGITKLLRGFDMKKRFINTRQRLVWSKHQDDGKQFPLWKTPAGFTNQRSLIIRQGKIEVPIKFKFKGNVQMYVK